MQIFAFRHPWNTEQIEPTTPHPQIHPMALPGLNEATIKDVLNAIGSPLLNELVDSGEFIPVLASTTSSVSQTTLNMDARLIVPGGFEAIIGLGAKTGRGALLVVKTGPKLGALNPKALHGGGTAYLVDVGSGPLVTMTAMRVGKPANPTVFAVRNMSIDIKRPVPIPGVLVYHVDFVNGEKLLTEDIENISAIETKGMILTLDTWTEWQTKLRRGEQVEPPRPLVSATSINPKAKGLAAFAKM